MKRSTSRFFKLAALLSEDWPSSSGGEKKEKGVG